MSYLMIVHCSLKSPCSYVDPDCSEFGLSTLFQDSLLGTTSPPITSFSLNYQGSPYLFTVGLAIPTIVPTVTGTVTSCTANPALPVGLSLSTSCDISGTPSALQANTSYTITATGPDITNTTIGITIAIPAPTGINVLSGNAQNTISWGAVAGAISYNIYWKNTAGVTKGSNVISGVTSPYAHTTLINGTSYFYRITAVGASGESNLSSEINATPASVCTNCRIYVTSSGYLPLTVFNSPLAADALCNSNAAKPVTGRSYKAMIVDSGARIACTTPNCSGGIGEHIDWVFYPSTQYYQSDGVTLVGTTDTNGLLIFPLITAPYVNSKYWTGMNADWTTNPTVTCNNWNDNTATFNGVCGNGLSTNSGLLNNWAPNACNIAQQLLCVEQ